MSSLYKYCFSNYIIILLYWRNPKNLSISVRVVYRTSSWSLCVWIVSLISPTMGTSRLPKSTPSFAKSHSHLCGTNWENNDQIIRKIFHLTGVISLPLYHLCAKRSSHQTSSNHKDFDHDMIQLSLLHYDNPYTCDDSPGVVMGISYKLSSYSPSTSCILETRTHRTSAKLAPLWCSLSSISMPS